MAVLAIVQSFPYDEVLGGDAAYIFGLANYLVHSGHVVHGFTTDVSRGRTKPFYRSAYAIERLRSWTVRSTVKVSSRTFFSPSGIQPLRILNRLSANRLFAASKDIPPVEQWARSEAQWVNQKLDELKPAAVILVHEALYFAPLMPKTCPKLALLGHIPETRENESEEDASRREDVRGSPAFRSKISQALACTDAVGINSREDLAFVRSELGIGSAIFVGMGYGEVASHPDSREPIVLFVGNATGPNMKALSWFASKIWPNILSSCPEARLRVVGRAALQMEEIAGRQIERVGPVDDLDPEYARAQLVAVPLVSGSAGVKIKVAEAMAHCRPVVTTSFGVDAKDPHQLDAGAIVANTASAFSEAVIKLLRDKPFRLMKADGAKKVFEEQFSYKACYQDIDSWLQMVSQDRPHGVVS